MTRATAFAPGSIGNVGPGFDVLGLAVDGIGDRVTVELTKGDSKVVDVTGRDADLVPRDADRNCAAIAANAYLRPFGYRAIVSIEKGLAFAVADGELLRRALDDRYAEPRRAPLIPRFYEVKRAALDAGAFGCSISGSGPTLFAIAASEVSAQACADAMQRAFGEIAAMHVAPIAKEGVRRA